MTKERFVKVNGKTYTESDVQKMNVEEIKELIFAIEKAEREIGMKKRDISERLKKSDPRKNDAKALATFSFVLQRFHEAQFWISLIRKQKSCELYKTQKLYENFVNISAKELKAKQFTAIMEKAKAMIV